MEKQWRTACPLNCYDVCGLIVSTKENKIIDIKGDPEHPITKGKICGRGKMLKDRIYNSRRLLYPQKKVGGNFVRISWDQALDEISQKITKAKREFGVTSIMHSYDYASGGLLKELDQRFFNYIGGMTKSEGSLCWGAGKQAQLYDFGDTLSHDVEDIANAKTIIVWGRNITTTNIHLFSFIDNAKQNGTKLIVIDPIKNSIAKKANLHVNIHPGMDGILALAISKIIIENDLYDHKFILEHSTGFELFRKEIEKLEIEKVSREINVEIEVINHLASMYAQQKPVMTFLGLGMQRYANGGNTVRAIDALIALSGNVGIPGGGVNYANLSVVNSFNLKELIREDLQKDYRTFSRPTQAEEILQANDPPIKMMFISRSNPVSQLPYTDRTISALNKIETKVVIDMYMTDSALKADYVLPTSSVFEEEDIYYGSMFHGIIRYGPKIIDPPGEAWSDLKIWSELAKKIGRPDFIKSNEEFFEISLKSLNKYGIDLKTLKEKSQIKLPIPTIPWQDKKFKTPSGKFEFYSKKALEEGQNPTASIVYPKENYKFNQKLKENYPYNLLSIHPSRSLHSQHFILLNHDKDKPDVIITNQIAEKLNINNNDLVKIYNDRGEITGYAKIANGNHENTIVIEEGWSIASNSSTNVLTPNQTSDMGKGSILYDCAVMIKKIN